MFDMSLWCAHVWKHIYHMFVLRVKDDKECSEKYMLLLVLKHLNLIFVATWSIYVKNKCQMQISGWGHHFDMSNVMTKFILYRIYDNNFYSIVVRKEIVICIYRCTAQELSVFNLLQEGLHNGYFSHICTCTSFYYKLCASQLPKLYLTSVVKMDDVSSFGASDMFYRYESVVNYVVLYFSCNQPLQVSGIIHEMRT